MSHGVTDAKKKLASLLLTADWEIMAQQEICSVATS